MKYPTSWPELTEALNNFDFEQFAFDVETWNPETQELAKNWYDLEVFMLSLYDGENSIVIPNHEFQDNVLKYTFKHTEDDATIIAHNIVFDTKALLKHDVNLHNKKWFDTIVAYHLLDETERGIGLKDAAERFLDADTTKIKDAYTPGRINDEFKEYAANDTVWTYQFAEKLWPRLQEENLDTLFKKIEMPFQRCIVEMETKGVAFNRDKCEEYYYKLEKELIKIKKEIIETLGYDTDHQTTLDEEGNMQIDVAAKHPPMWTNGGFNFNSSHQKRHLFYNKWDLPVVKETDGGQPSTDSDTLKRLRSQVSGDKQRILNLLLEYSAGEQLMSNFVESLPEHVDEDEKIRPDFNDTGTITGRLSCSDPNLQNLPNGVWRDVKVREIFEARPGKKMVAVDFSGQENRVTAQVTDDPQMKEAIEQNKDLHLVHANNVFDLGLSEDDFIKGTQAHSEAKEEHYSERQQAKVFSYGILYGGNEYTLMDAFGCDEEQAKQYLQDYYDMFPGMKKAREEAHEKVEEQGFVESMYGRRRHFEAKQGDYGDTYYTNRDYRQAFNFLIQSPGADMMRVALIKTLNYKHRNPEYGVNLLLTVHDEAVVECDEEYAETVADDIEELFASVVGDGFVVDMPAHSDIGDNYAEAK